MLFEYPMPKLLKMNQRGKYANVYATYELTSSNHVARSAVHRCCY